MTFIITLVALLVERFYDWSHLRNWQWYYRYQSGMTQRLPGKSPALILISCIVPMMIGAILIEFIFHSIAHGAITYIFELAVLLYCLGPRNLWADTFAAINALVRGDHQAAEERLKTAFGITDMRSSQVSHQQLLKSIFVEAGHRVFSVVFWFFILGPAGALMSRALALAANESRGQDLTDSEFVRHARSFCALADWIPVRIFTGIFALGGHFSKVIACWNKKLLLDLENNDAMLSECGIAALGMDEKSTLPEDGSVEKNAISLLDRAFVITLVIIAVLSLLF